MKEYDANHGYEAAMKIIQEHEMPIKNPSGDGVYLTQEETEALYFYLDCYTPRNLQDDEDWDKMGWLYKVMSVWKKCCDATENGKTAE